MRARDVLSLVVPALQFIEIDIVGRLFLSELVLLALLPFLWVGSNKSIRSGLPKWPFLLGTAWLLGQILTDMVRSSAFVDYSRGWSKIGFLMVNLAAILLLVAHSRRRLMLFAIGQALGVTFTYLFDPGPFAASDPWKFGYGTAVTLATVLIASTRHVWKAPLIPTALIFLMAGINLFFGFRSLGGICLLTALYLAVQRLLPTKELRARVTTPKLLFAGVVGLLVVWSTLGMYGYAASNGILGREAQQAYEEQSSGAYGILLGGRTEAIGAIQAIRDAPLLGHGSWAKDASYRSYLNAQLRLFGYAVQHTDSELIPTHSYLLGAWVESGAVGALFWLAVLVLTARVLLVWYQSDDRLSPLVVFVAISLCWNTLFSPFGAQARLLVPFYIAVLFYALKVAPPRVSRISGAVGVRNRSE